MSDKMIVTPAGPRLDRVAEAHALRGFALLRQLGFKVTVVLPMGRIDIVGPTETRKCADEVVESWQGAMRRLATWSASGLDDVTLGIGTEVFLSDSDESAIFSVRKATLEEVCAACAELLRTPQGLRLCRRDASAIADAIDGLTQVLVAERAPRRT